VNKTFCPLPFSHLAIRPNGKVYPCCIFDWDHVPKDLDLNHPDVFNHPFMQEIRQKMINNEPVQGCNRCYSNEKITGSSTRVFFLKTAKDHDLPTEPINSPELKYLDLALSNTCNNKCRMCNAELSTSWYADAKALGLPIPKGILRQEQVLKQYDLSKLRFIKMIGGEPLMEQDKFIDVLRRCDRKNLSIMLTTNVTLIPNDELQSLLKECKDVSINLSIDAYGKLNDFLRKGSKWEKTEKVLEWFYNNYDPKKITVHSVVSIYNANKIDELFTYIKSTYPKVGVSFVMIDGPEWMHPRHLPEYAKQEIAQLVKIWYELTGKDFCNLLISELEKTGDFRLFMKHDEKLNDLRNEHWKTANPELYKMVKQYYD
jgi:MoaA/NifB/PqqE/SkfB family radical SAM enzyme